MRQAGRDEECVTITTLDRLEPEDIDMFTVLLIGNSRSYESDGWFITPRGYYPAQDEYTPDAGPGQSIMINSFRTIARELRHPDIPLYLKWPMLHAILPNPNYIWSMMGMVQEIARDKNSSEI